ncbi:tripartite-type tricarboxylate transporter receptor subunit TctC [Neorhizobium galegae]|uniref:Bug family tripartite tricarboxylate transporter substrate binding protein n=1 Tax=Neorhizobium galegae TaxID=399 RepID=UPI00277DE8BA|nr:tripartite tricarboxylate transporter substrate binding protein [Neorhizobium galegae]MDQ0137740.1 tripartite-type tricarboxylate transporter receptor subunit TctC [Neorhizobium galegae]
MKFNKLASLAFAACAFANSAWADTKWPERPVTFILPFTAGGGVDGTLRFVAERLRAKFNTTFIVENRPGAGGNIGVQAVAGAAPDGYTFVAGTNSTHVTNPLIQDVPYDVKKDFVSVNGLFVVPNVLLVRSGLNIKTTQELVAYLKEHPNGLFFGTTGVGSSQHFGGELFKSMTGTSMKSVTYKGAAEIMTALLGGHLDVAFQTSSASAGGILSDPNVRALGVSTGQRLSTLPDLPTISEALPGFEMSAWAGIWAPAGTPNEIVEKLSSAILEIQKTPEFKEFMDRLVATSLPMGPAEFDKFLDSERQKWGAIVKK